MLFVKTLVFFVIRIKTFILYEDFKRRRKEFKENVSDNLLVSENS